MKAAIQNNAGAQFNLGVLYNNGEGTVQNYEEAFKWYMKAAMQNDAAAQRNVGLRYIEGKGVTKNKEEGLKWLQKAADKGDKQAIEKIKSLNSSFWDIFK